MTSNRLRFLIASGPTREPIDPVRYISNYSTGVMGQCLANAVIARGHKVTFVECPKDAETARDLGKKLATLLPKHDVLVMVAAVCDARPATVSSTKVKKESLTTIKLVRNPDILASLAKKKKKNQVFIGFGLESSSILENGSKKLKNKGLELIVLQRVMDKNVPFGNRFIEAFLLKKNGSHKRFASISKKRLARVLVREVEHLFRS